MKTLSTIGTLAVAFIGLCVAPAQAGNAEEIARCANAIDTRTEAVIWIGKDRFRCRNGIIVSDDPKRRGLQTFNNNHAYFEGNFAHLNPVIANDVIRFYITIENWAAPHCTIEQPMVQIERKSRLKKLADLIPNKWDWKSIPSKIDGPWEYASAYIAAAAVAKWHKSNFANCRRNGW